jgi:hypothetical protein
MLLRSHLTIEPLEADRTKVLNVYRTTELYMTNKTTVGLGCVELEISQKVFTLSV